ncbi:MAG: hypothetical protein K9G39_06590 [Chlorobium sp.]|uniref:hypothetical protein n=1 Tax=Chlorobium sp. TaxID=1095 RepID=UPI0025B80463|nr:hypothetical protein [Chlorobium sp.]MCF8383250.1 hypothetical protein [Chlorobium sp.]
MALHLGEATGIVMRTSAYLFYRAMVYGVLVAVVAVFLGILVLIGSVFGGGAAAVLFFLALLGGGFGFRLIREYVLYLLQAGHIALITEIVENGSLPSGISQTAWAKERVMGYFREVSVLALVDQLIKGVLRSLNRTLFNVMQALPIPALEGLASIVQRVVNFSLTYIDESVIAYTFRTKNSNVFDAAKSGILIYCQSWKPILKNAVALTVLSYVFVAITTIVFMIPFGAAALFLPSSWSFAKFALFVLALFLGVSAKWILFDPVACTSTLLTFLKEAETTKPDPAWEARIEAVSDQFRTLKEKAAGMATGTAINNG